MAADPEVITFRRHAIDTKALLIPMINGLDIPHVVEVVIKEDVHTATVTMTCKLPHGVLVEP